jgi:hypothetical protein
MIEMQVELALVDYKADISVAMAAYEDKQLQLQQSTTSLLEKMSKALDGAPALREAQLEQLELYVKQMEELANTLKEQEPKKLMKKLRAELREEHEALKAQREELATEERKELAKLKAELREEHDALKAQKTDLKADLKVMVIKQLKALLKRPVEQP